MLLNGAAGVQHHNANGKEGIPVFASSDGDATISRDGVDRNF